ncbi:hypothetical protein LZ32DRAFT_661838 [Colletotrichum eremochloae]|nr:hypothetical protein LZ32DRAFT_661838 [Colletotrichum eremochloae]
MPFTFWYTSPPPSSFDVEPSRSEDVKHAALISLHVSGRRVLDAKLVKHTLVIISLTPSHDYHQDSVSLDEQTAFRDNPLDTLKKTQFEECNRGIGMLQHKIQMTKVGRLRETQTSTLVEDSQWYHYQARRPRTYKVQDP